MRRYINLEFFNKEGISCNFEYNDELEKWTGAMYLKRVSAGLFETEHVFIYEKLSYNNIETFAKPHIYQYDTSQNVYFEWTENRSKAISLFSVENDAILKKESLTIPFDTSSSDVIDEDAEIIITSNIDESYISINVCIDSDSEGIYRRTLLIKDLNDSHIIAEIDFYGEVIGEDERLKVLCNNLGYFISPEDERIFTGSDIDEEKIDFILLNRKRKEILLEGSNIFPFIGSYKGLINAINYFGFDDLKVREYWLNINLESTNYGKYKQNEILSVFDSSVDLSTPLVDTRNHRKTNNIALVYQINKADFDDLTKYDLPEIEETYQYTVEEVLIKLFALKRKLKKTFLPFNINIKDIIGEATFFSKINKTYIPSESTKTNLEIGVSPKINLLSNNDYIIDLRDEDELFGQYELLTGFDRDMTAGNNIYTGDDLADYLLALFRDYYPHINTIEELPDKPDIPIGCPIILKNDTFSLTYEDLNIAYRDIENNRGIIVDMVCSEVYNGYTYTIEETISGTSIVYVATAIDTKEDIIDNLYNLFLAQTDLPWPIFTPSIIDKDGLPALRIEMKNINSDKLKADFKSYSTNTLDADSNFLTNYVVSLSNSYTYETIGNRNFYELEWEVTHSEMPEKFSSKIRGDINYYETISFVLPIAGKYNVTLRLFDTNNRMSIRTIENFIDVKVKNVDFIGAYKRVCDEFSTILSLKDSKYSENKITSYNPLVYNDTQIGQCQMTYKTLSMVDLLPNLNYENYYLYSLGNFRPDLSINFPGPGTYQSVGDDVTYTDMKYLTYKMVNVSGDTPASFDITEINIGGLIQVTDFINGAMGRHIFTTNDLKDAADELNSNSDPIISKYVYNYIDNDEGHFLNQNSYIHAAGKFFGKNCDIEKIDVENIVVENIQNSRDYSFDMATTQILDSFKDFKGAVYILFSSDNSKLPGKKNYTWLVQNLIDDTFNDLYFYGKDFGYLFHKKGKYRITLEIEDANDNKKSISKNALIIS